MERLANRARVKPGVHILRHAFYCHLAIRAPVSAFDELANYQDLGTTQRTIT